MLYQIHQQQVDDPQVTELIAQGEPPKEISATDLSSFVRNWLADVSSRHPLRDGWQWMICDENCDHFKWARVVADALRANGIEVKAETERKMIDSEYPTT